MDTRTRDGREREGRRRGRGRHWDCSSIIVCVVGRARNGTGLVWREGGGGNQRGETGLGAATKYLSVRFCCFTRDENLWRPKWSVDVG